MPNGKPPDAEFVTWGRWQAEHQALTQRISDLERRVHERWESEASSETTRKTRIWQAALALVTGLVLPLGLLGILALIHLVTKQ